MGEVRDPPATAAEHDRFPAAATHEPARGAPLAPRHLARVIGTLVTDLAMSDRRQVRIDVERKHLVARRNVEGVEHDAILHNGSRRTLPGKNVYVGLAHPA